MSNMIFRTGQSFRRARVDSFPLCVGGFKLLFRTRVSGEASTKRHLPLLLSNRKLQTLVPRIRLPHQVGEYLPNKIPLGDVVLILHHLRECRKTAALHCFSGNDRLDDP